MSHENVEVAQRNQDAWNRRDLTTWLATFRSDAEIDWSRARGLFRGVYRGPQEHRVLAHTAQLRIHQMTLRAR
jgi:hypothetical protein